MHAQCPKADSCLHRIAFDMLRTSTDYLRLLNPDHCTADDRCPHYRSSQSVRYARGFANFQSHMYPQQYESFKNALIRRFGRSPYYKRRSGELDLSPNEQAVVLRALKRAGVTEQLTVGARLRRHSRPTRTVSKRLQSHRRMRFESLKIGKA